MTNAELRQLYEKLYFNEAEARDKIVSRLQIPLSLLVAIVGAVIFLLQNYEPHPGPFTAPRVLFWLFLITGSFVLAIAIERFVRALHNNEYHLLPDTIEIANYKTVLEATYDNYTDREILVAEAMDAFIVGAYVDNAAFNTRTNDRRSLHIHQCTDAIIAAVVLLAAAYLVFFFGDMDRSKLKSPTEVFIQKPVDVRIGK